MRIKKGDTVLVTRGKDKGKQGNVERAFQVSGKVLVAGVNQYKKHVKKNVTGQGSEIVVITKPMPVEAVALVCPKCKKQTRIGYKIDKDVKTRICKKCGKEI